MMILNISVYYIISGFDPRLQNVRFIQIFHIILIVDTFYFYKDE